jgi:hypothetical protein
MTRDKKSPWGKLFPEPMSKEEWLTGCERRAAAGCDKIDAAVKCWLGLFEQIFGIAKWNACRV